MKQADTNVRKGMVRYGIKVKSKTLSFPKLLTASMTLSSRVVTVVRSSCALFVVFCELCLKFTALVNKSQEDIRATISLKNS